MTDYSSVWDKDDEYYENQKKERERKAREEERKRVDNEFENIVLKKRTTCSDNSDLIKYIKHLKSMKKALKAAEADGFCLDEILDGLGELNNE